MNFKALIGSVVIASITLASTIPVTTFQFAVSDNFRNNTYTNIYNVSFKKILKVAGSDFVFDNSRRYFSFWKDNILGASDLPVYFWSEANFVNFYVKDNIVWDSVASVYGFNRGSTYDEIVKLMRENSVLNVSVKISYLNNKGEWDLLNFSVS